METETLAKEIAEANGRDWEDMGGYERQTYMEAAQEAVDNYDGAPYCQYCGALSRKHCDCGPIADNH